MSYVAIVAVYLFVVGFATGPGSIPWFFVTELFSQSGRPIASSIAVAVNWSANFLVGLGFSPITVKKASTKSSSSSGPTTKRGGGGCKDGTSKDFFFLWDLKTKKTKGLSDRTTSGETFFVAASLMRCATLHEKPADHVQPYGYYRGWEYLWGWEPGRPGRQPQGRAGRR